MVDNRDVVFTLADDIGSFFDNELSSKSIGFTLDFIKRVLLLDFTSIRRYQNNTVDLRHDSLLWDLAQSSENMRSAMCTLVVVAQRQLNIYRAINYGVTGVYENVPAWDFDRQLDVTAKFDLGKTLDLTQHVLVARIGVVAKWAVDRCIPLRLVYESTHRLQEETKAVRGEFDKRFTEAEHEFLCEYQPNTNECLRILESLERRELMQQCDVLAESVNQLQLLLHKAMNIQMHIKQCVDAMEHEFKEKRQALLGKWSHLQQTIQYEVEQLEIEYAKLEELKYSVTIIAQVNDSVQRLISQEIADLIERTKKLQLKNDVVERGNLNKYDKAVRAVRMAGQDRAPGSELTTERLQYLQQTPYPRLSLPIEEVLKVHESFCVRQCNAILQIDLNHGRLLAETKANITRDRLVVFYFNTAT